MLPRDYEEQNCAVAGTLEVIGERWTLLIVRDALLGVCRFEDFQARLGASRTVLAARLARLVDDGVMRRERYQRRPERFEYVLTERGLELWPVVAAMAQWGEGRFEPDGAPRSFTHGACGTPIITEVRCPECDVALAPEEVVSEQAPGARMTRVDHLGEELRAALKHKRPLLQSVRD